MWDILYYYIRLIWNVNPGLPQYQPTSPTSRVGEENIGHTLTTSNRTKGLATCNNRTSLSKQLQQNLEGLRELLGNSSDVVFRQLLPADCTQLAIVYIEGLIDNQLLQQDVIRPILKTSSDGEITPTQVKDKVVNVGGVSSVTTYEDACNGLLSGGALILIDGYMDGLIVSIPGLEERAIAESKAYPNIRGPQDAFTEAISTNTSLVRHRVKDEEVLNQDNQLTIFPMLYNTDRPDTIAAGVMEGRIAIFIDGTPFVLLAPTLFVDFLQSAEDNYQSYLNSDGIVIELNGPT